jgi:hypothetical protein
MSDVCPEGIPATVWFDWWNADLDPAEEKRLEEHLFACDACAAEAQAARARCDGIRDAVRRHPLAGGASKSLLEALGRDRRVVRRFTLPWNGSVQCAVGAEDDLVVLELQGDFRDVERVDAILAREGHLLRRDEDLPLVHGSAVLWGETGDALRQFPRATFEVVLLAVDDAGDREIARYTLHHAPFED